METTTTHEVKAAPKKEPHFYHHTGPAGYWRRMVWVY